MKAVVVDTNVPVVANERSKQASPECVKTCINRLRDLMRSGKLVLDDRWLILKEYMNNLRSEGQPGVGDAFLRWVLTNHANARKCEKVPITPVDLEQGSFAEFPADPSLRQFHTKDRKFVAVALAHPERPPLWQAVDPDWWKHREALARAGAIVEFLCEADIVRLLGG